MNEITQYKADDGSIWAKSEDAAKRDAEHAKMETVMRPLGARYDDPRNCDYQNGDGYVQHDPDTVRRVKTALIELSRPLLPTGWAERQTKPLVEIGADWFNRFIDDSGPVSRAWSRLNTIDGQGREWGQPYYATHPHEANCFEIVR